MIVKRTHKKLILWLCVSMGMCFNFGGCTKPEGTDIIPDKGRHSSRNEKKEKNQNGEEKKATLDNLEEKIDSIIKEMTLEEKTAQLFIITPETLTNIGTVIEAGDTTKKMFHDFPIGGLVYFSNNLQSEDQVQTMLKNMQRYSRERIGLPVFLAVDEEGGDVVRIGGKENFNAPNVGDMWEIGQSGSCVKAYETGKIMGDYLSNLGFNLDFAPVADVLSNQNNMVIGKRSFGTDCNIVADMVENELKGLEEYHVKGVIKHFPGHGSTLDDTHDGSAYTEKTLDEMMSNEIVPFQKAIENQIDFIMVGHFSAPNISQDSLPCSLSKVIVTDLLRNQLNYTGLIVTDALNMGAITQQYDAKTAALMALRAGNDLLLMPENFMEAYNGILEECYSGQISEERINESVRRILSVKIEMEDVE